MKKSRVFSYFSSFALVIFFTTFVLFTNNSFAQKTVTEQDLVWYSLVSTFNMSENWYFQNELHERHFISPNVQHQSLIRAHIHRKLGMSGWESSVGACYFLQNSNDPYSKINLTIPEFRPHFELAYKQKLDHLSFDHRYQVEARYFHNLDQTKTELDDGFSFGNYRFRYRLQATLPIYKISENRSLKIKVSDEIFINTGSSIVKNPFDQNRVYAGLNYDLLPNLGIEVGYLNWFQQTQSGSFYDRDIFRFVIFHSISLPN